MERVTAFGTEEQRLHRIQGLVMAENVASARVPEKNGYRAEGVLKLYPFGKEFHDTVMMAYVKAENLEANR